MSEFTQFADPCFELDKEDINLVATNTGALIHLNARGWLDVADATALRDWLDALIPKVTPVETCAAPGIKVGDRVRINIGEHSALPLEGWTVYRLPTRDWPSYGVKHDNGGDMTINSEYVIHDTSATAA